ncbi:F-box domain-containing protein [Delitschia confertaspora ATCC 74209]|uniref:F-box domain-containing protein n=1 Tax=Delitschia confertaspora ATCC 74209 TaxID=1513339 RepID=A0A9P4JHM9_9PLEO|nr:F-box domain-containing protein [Delitschia confertaspora ATCC 74209]
MSFETIPTELITQIFLSCPTISSVVALASTCHHFHTIYASSQRLLMLAHAAEAEFGPLQDLTQLLTHNSSQPAHLVRNAPFSDALLKQIVHRGRVAEKWCDLYPFKKWKYDYESRRLLTREERYRVRRAIYRLWLYTRAFHNPSHPRETRVQRLVIQKRAQLLHNWSTVELAEMADVHAVVREVLTRNVCPSNGAISRKFKKRWGTENGHQLLFNIHLNYPPPSSYQAPYPTKPETFSLSDHFQNNSPSFSSHTRYNISRHHDPGSEGWGDDIPHYYVVEDMLKLDPEQILWLKENAPLKGQVEMWVRSWVGGVEFGEGDWFENNGETWGQTLEWVLGERGEDEVMDMVVDGVLGVAVDTEVKIGCLGGLE